MNNVDLIDRYAGLRRDEEAWETWERIENQKRCDGGDANKTTMPNASGEGRNPAAERTA